MESRYLEAIALVFSFAGLISAFVAVVFWHRFNRRTRANKRVDPQDRQRTAWRIFLGALGYGVCMAITGLSLSLWSPTGLDRLTLREILFSFLLCGGGSSVLTTMMFLLSSTTTKLLYEKKDTNRENNK